MVLTPMPVPPSSMRRASEMAARACLVAEYMPMYGGAMCPATEETLTMWPRRWSLHVGDGGLDAVDRAPDVDLEEVAGVLEVAVGDRREEADAGVVDQDVDRAELLDGLADQRFDGEPLGDVGRDDEAAAGERSEVGGDALELVAGAGGEDDVGAALRRTPWRSRGRCRKRRR